MRAIAIAGVFFALATAASFAGEGALAPLSQQAFLERIAGRDAPYVLDVRTAEEYVAGHVPGALNIPHDQLASRLAEVPKDRDVVLYCRSGRRALLAGEVLEQAGYTRLEHLEGDIIAWTEQGRPMEKPRDPAACTAALAAGPAAGAKRACAPN
jgi:phage shock protein E